MCIRDRFSCEVVTPNIEIVGDNLRIERTEAPTDSRCELIASIAFDCCVVCIGEITTATNQVGSGRLPCLGVERVERYLWLGSVPQNLDDPSELRGARCQRCC